MISGLGLLAHCSVRQKLNRVSSVHLRHSARIFIPRLHYQAGSTSWRDEQVKRVLVTSGPDDGRIEGSKRARNSEGSESGS